MPGQHLTMLPIYEICFQSGKFLCMKCYVSMRCENCEIQTVVLHFLLKVTYWVNITLFKNMHYIILFQILINKTKLIIMHFNTFTMNVNSYTTIGKLLFTTSTL